MNPVIVSFGNFEIRWYAVLILVGMTLALMIMKKEAKRFNVKDDFMFNMCCGSNCSSNISWRITRIHRI